MFVKMGADPSKDSAKYNNLKRLKLIVFKNKNYEIFKSWKDKSLPPSINNYILLQTVNM